MDAKSLRRLLPRDKEDAKGAAALVALGYEAVEPVLKEMLDWLKVIRSPVASIMGEFFVSLGVRAVPPVQKALGSRNETLQYSVVLNVVAKWPHAAIEAVKPELQLLASNAGPYGTDLIALRLLVEHDLADRAWLKQWAQFKTKRLRELLLQAEEIERSLD